MDFTCTICGKQVSKRQSYAHGGGRACKIHEEAQGSNQGRIDDKKEKDAAREEQVRARQERRDRRFDWRGNAEIMANGCWKCRKMGVTRAAYYQLMLVGLEREKMKGEFNLLTNPGRTRELAGMDESTLLLLPYKLTRSCRLDQDTYLWTQMSGNEVQLCQHCAKEAGYDPEARMKELSAKVPQISLDKLMLLGSIYEVSEHHEAIVKTAEILEAAEQEGKV